MTRTPKTGTRRPGAASLPLLLLFAALLLLSLPPGHPRAQDGTPPTWPSLAQPAPPTGDGKHDAAVLVGIDRYDKLDRVPGAVDNVLDWYVWLKDTRGASPARLRLLRDGEATRERIEEEVDVALREVGAEGTVWFVFVGHGAPAESGDDGLLVGADARASVASIRARSVGREDLVARLGEGPQARTMVVVDACFSGRAPSGEALVEGLQSSLVPAWATTSATTSLLTAARSDQFAGSLPYGSRPAFSYLLLGALRGWGDANRDGHVTSREAVDYTRDALLTVLQGRRSQEPEADLADEGQALAAASERGPDLSAFVLRRSTGGIEGGTTVEDAEFLDLVRRAEEAAARRGELEEEQRRLDEERARLRGEKLAELSVEVQGRASRSWAATRTLRELGGPEAVRAIEAYVETYGAAVVEVDGVSKGVPVAEVALAEAWLSEHGGSSAPVSGSSVLSSHGYELIRIPSGEFQMGSPAGEAGRDDDERQHRVVLTRGFLLGRTEVTQSLYASVMGSNPSGHAGCAECPVEKVSWLDAVEFCNRLSEREGLPPAYEVDGESVDWNPRSGGYRLPTEAEWEYAARAGERTLYSGSDDPESVGWYRDNSGRKSHPVGELAANAWGLQDMSGNVWEWVWDAYAADYSSATEDPVVEGVATSGRVCRGGSWFNGPADLRVANRNWGSPGLRIVYLGFRLARSE